MDNPSFHGGTVFLLLVCLTGVLSQCPCVEVDDAIVNVQCNGVYSQDGTMCTDRHIYKHNYNDLYMYYYNVSWLVGTQPCTPAGPDLALMKAYIGVQFPEYIPDGAWYEDYGDGWTRNWDIGTDCHDGDDDDDLSEGAIAGICIGVMLLVAILVLLGFCLYKNNKKATAKKTHPQPALQLPPNAPGMAGYGQNQPGYGLDQPPGYGHNMNAYYIPSAGEKQMAPHFVAQYPPTEGPQVMAEAPPSYEDVGETKIK